MIKAFIFDMDGVILDTEPLSLQSFNHVLRNYVEPISLEEFKAKYMGHYDISVCGRMVEELNLPITKEELISAKTEAYLKILQNDIEPIKGAVEAIREIHKMMPIALASSSNKSKIEIITKKFGIYELFSALVSSYEVAKDKPAPDVYLKVSQLLGVSPNECAVIEDAPLGIAAAKGAGMYCFGFTTNYPAAKLAAADQVINSFDQLIPAIKILNSN